MHLLNRPLGAIALLSTAALAAFGSPHAEHVFIISIDGGKPAVIAQSEMPILKQLAAEGACTWSARTIFPSITLPSHTSMLTGVGPDKHHILWNTWEPRKGFVSVPTIFAEAKKAGYSTAMFVGKEKFRHLAQSGTVDEFQFDREQSGEVTKVIAGNAKPETSSTVPARIVAKSVARYILEQRPNLCFIHFTDPDDIGHKYGWGSPEQRRALGDVDAALGEVLKALEVARIRDRSVLIITADHGGHGKTHGLSTPEDMIIPWVAWGEGVKKNFTITAPVITYDTAATALGLLAVPCPRSFDGIVVASAFTWKEEQVVSRGLPSP
jgi:predicted AlkP superfamily pyrophosphatase or phosphodiesterase